MGDTLALLNNCIRPDVATRFGLRSPDKEHNKPHRLGSRKEKGVGAMVVQQLRLGLWMRYWAGLRLAPHVGTPSHVGKRMLQLASVGPHDHVVDLGCGDGRLLIAAAKLYGAKCYGVELDPQLFEEAQRAVAQEGMEHLINIERRDAFSVDLSKASVVTLYLSVKGNSRLLPMLQQQLPFGARVVSFCWPFEALEPARVTQVDGINLYLYKFNGGNAS